MDLGSSLAVGHGSTVHLSGQGLDHCLVMCFESTSQLLLPVPLGWRAPGQQETQITRILPLCVSEQWLSRVQVIAQSSPQAHPEQLLDMNTAGKEGSGPSCGSAELV